MLQKHSMACVEALKNGTSEIIVCFKSFYYTAV